MFFIYSCIMSLLLENIKSPSIVVLIPFSQYKKKVPLLSQKYMVSAQRFSLS